MLLNAEGSFIWGYTQLANLGFLNSDHATKMSPGHCILLPWAPAWEIFDRNTLQAYGEEKVHANIACFSHQHHFYSGKTEDCCFHHRTSFASIMQK